MGLFPGPGRLDAALGMAWRTRWAHHDSSYRTSARASPRRDRRPGTCGRRPVARGPASRRPDDRQGDGRDRRPLSRGRVVEVNCTVGSRIAVSPSSRCSRRRAMKAPPTAAGAGEAASPRWWPRSAREASRRLWGERSSRPTLARSDAPSPALEPAAASSPQVAGLAPPSGRAAKDHLASISLRGSGGSDDGQRPPCRSRRLSATTAMCFTRRGPRAVEEIRVIGLRRTHRRQHGGVQAPHPPLHLCRGDRRHQSRRCARTRAGRERSATSSPCSPPDRRDLQGAARFPDDQRPATTRPARLEAGLARSISARRHATTHGLA